MSEIRDLEMTAEMLGEALRIDKDHAYGLIRFGEERGWIGRLGNMPAKNKRGRGATIYRIPRDLGARIKALWDNGWFPKD